MPVPFYMSVMVQAGAAAAHSAAMPRHPHETREAGEGGVATCWRIGVDTARHMPQGIDKHVAANESYA